LSRLEKQLRLEIDFLLLAWYKRVYMDKRGGKSHTYLTSSPDVMGGAPVIRGTRVPIAVILHLLKQGYPLEVIHDDYPNVPFKTLSKAVDEAITIISDTLHATGISQTQSAT
jgi:uncharacterized protein (DUF433 family)